MKKDTERQPPIKVLHLFKLLDERLISLLSSLNPADWNRSTIAKRWTVKDIAAHLLDGNLRTLSASRDKYFGESGENITSYRDLVEFLNGLNADWVKAMKRVSPGALIELLSCTGKAFIQHLYELEMFAPAVYSVGWAGEEVSENWFHIAREYTEKWIHQQQIRDAVGKEGIMTQVLFYPFIDTFMRGLPHTYRDIEAPLHTTVKISVTTSIGGDWYLRKADRKWLLEKENNGVPGSEIYIPPQTAWKLFSKGISPQEAKDTIRIKGNIELGEVALTMISVMA